MNVLNAIIIGLGFACLMLAVVTQFDRRPGSSSLIVRCDLFLERLMATTLKNYEHAQVLGVLLPIIVFLLIPLAALLNTLLGGSPFLLSCYLIVVAFVIFLLLLEEYPKTDLLRIGLAWSSAVTAFVLLPLYTVYSFSTRMLQSSPVQGALMSLVIAFILYAALAGIWTLFINPREVKNTAAGISEPISRFMASALFFTPVSYVVFWFFLMVLSLLDFTAVRYNTFPTLVIFVLGGAVAYATFKSVLGVAAAQTTETRWGAVLLSSGLGALAIVLGFTLN